MVFYRFKVHFAKCCIIVLSLMMIACTHSDKSQRMAQLLQQTIVFFANKTYQMNINAYELSS